ncbi:MAG: nucleoside-diphosphate kinase [Dethiobacteria bacterium]|nr:nucleoside-diphosphate kinase [Bacillota bacterium]HOP69061.1 nucleoside-diphosphate kinase [Bacillota bacterium]HPT33693.1 nucleoside-diphosphate kinase [Bacillota bacterium]HQD06901.1 nucleoside-diphosphate kinase [Bacillota bacterium]
MKTRERTFIMIKPDGVQRGLVGEVISRLERKGLKLTAMKMMVISEELAAQHYGEHKGKDFYDSLVSYITSGPVVAMVWEGDRAVTLSRIIIGATDPAKAAPGTIRGDLAISVGNNLVHGSDSLASAEREIKLFFSQEELIDYRLSSESWIYGEE